MGLKQDIYDNVIVGNADMVRAFTSQAIAAGFTADELLNDALIPAMTEVGGRFERQEFYVPEMLVAARAMKHGVEVLRPLLAEAGTQPLGTVVVGTVAGDLHDIGKNLVVMMLEGTGFRVVDLGVDVSADGFVRAVRANSPQLVGLSALLTTTMPGMRSTIDALKAACLRDQVVVMVGGAPLTQSYADEIGADLYAPDASSAARRAKQAIA